MCTATRCTYCMFFAIVTGNCVIHHPLWLLQVAFCGMEVFVWTVVSTVTLCKNKMHLCFCLQTSLCSITASLVNKVHSVFQLGEMCVSVSTLIQSVSMGSMSYFVCCCSLCVCRLPEYLCICGISARDCVFSVHVRSVTICERLYLTVCACVCVRVCAYEEQYSLGC